MHCRIIKIYYNAPVDRFAVALPENDLGRDVGRRAEDLVVVEVRVQRALIVVGGAFETITYPYNYMVLYKYIR